jgi:diguanylate cyclase (GGDEF)-like protein/PAS domain S-box-containing protein
MALASQDAGSASARADGPEPPVRAPSSARRRLDPNKLAYLIAPGAFAVVFVLMRFGYVARVHWWAWLIVFVTIVVVNLQMDRVYRHRPNELTLHLRVACQVVGVTIAIYLTGWGPVLWATYIFIALENLARVGSRVWKLTVLYSIIGMALGQFAIVQGWLPSELHRSDAASLTVMGAFVLFFVIRMAAAVMEQNETALAQTAEAEATLRLSEDRFRSLIQNSSDVTMILGEGGVFRYVSPAIKDLLQYEPEELIGRLSTDFVQREDLDTVLKALGGNDFQEGSGTATLEFRMLRRDGTSRDVEAVVSNQTHRPSVAGYVSNIRDVTERKKFEALLAFRALHDPLTGLANRQLILDRAQQMLVRARRSGVPVAALFIDLDNFKDSNDSLGHGAGDKLLQMVAGRLLGILRSGDTVGRLGGDEFVILAEGVSFARGPEMIAERVHEVLKPAFHLPGIDTMSITVSASIGIAVGDRPSAEDLLRDADIALYRAKGAGRDQSVLFERSMQSAAKERLTLKSDLETALEERQFSLLYHPIFDLDGIEIQGVEALLRWDHPVRGTITPDVFIPVLEERGLIVDVGRWVLNESCREAAAWHRMGHRASMSVNVSMRQLEGDQLIDDVQAALITSGLEPSLLILEVTESTLMRDSVGTVARLNRLKQLGVKVAIDDFGTGYSSLAYLRQFPVDVLKIDRSFVADMSRSPDAAALIHTLIELGRTLGLETLAEGIETHEQLEGLRAEGCNHGQGFLFSGPVTGVEMTDLLEIAYAGKPITSVDPAGAAGSTGAADGAGAARAGGGAAGGAGSNGRTARAPRQRTASGSRPGGGPR